MAGKKHGKNHSRTPNQTMLRRTLFMLIVCGIVAFIVLGLKLFQIQVLQHDYYESLAIEQQVRETKVTASRGTIYDRNKKILAMSASADTIYISPKEIELYGENPSLIAAGLSEILGVDYDSILEKCGDTSSWYKTIALKVEQDVSDRVREFKNENELKGVKIENDTKRYYPYSSLAAHVIGFVGSENIGLSGIEITYDEELTGVNGRVVRAKNSMGTDILFTKFEDYYDAVDGNDLVLTIDSTIQYYVEKHLQQAILDYDVQNGAACIAMDPNTAEILAMASLGNFDLNNYQLVSEDVMAEIEEEEDESVRDQLLYNAQMLQWRNKALSDAYEPGSTFKILTLAMALEEGVVDMDDTFYCGGTIDVLGRDDPVNCWKTPGHGAQTLVQAVQHSCNVAFVNIGLRVGERNFYKYAKGFGLFDQTKIDLGGEGYSDWWTEEVFFNENNLSQLAVASFGQTFTITPIQLITAVSACCNGGYLMKPYMVQEVVGNDGTTISATEPTTVRQVISEETSATMRQILEQVVGDRKEGTGKNAYVAGYRIAGKTGTSEKVAQDVAGGPKEYIASFIGFAPADDPQIVVLVLLDTPTNEPGIYISGGQMGAPTVGKIFADVLPYMGVEAVYTEEEIANMDKTVPNLVGMTVDEATAMLASRGLDIRTVGTGTKVTTQLPKANYVVASGSQVIVYLDALPSDELEEMPDITNLSYSVARQRLGYYGLYLKTVAGMAQDAETVIVTKQSITAGELIEHGTVIEVELADSDTSMFGRY